MGTHYVELTLRYHSPLSKIYSLSLSAVVCVEYSVRRILPRERGVILLSILHITASGLGYSH